MDLRNTFKQYKHTLLYLAIATIKLNTSGGGGL